MKYFFILSVLIGCANLIESGSSYHSDNETDSSSQFESNESGSRTDEEPNNTDHYQINPKIRAEPNRISPTNASEENGLYQEVNYVEVNEQGANLSEEVKHLQVRLVNEGGANQTGPTTNLTNPCKMGLDAGPCFGKFLKFYFDNAEQKCKAFFYGGCYGNANQFQTVEECKFTCIENDWPPFPINNQTEGNKTEAKVFFNPSTQAIFRAI